MNSCHGGSASFCQKGLTGPGGASFTSIAAGNPNIQISIAGNVASISGSMQVIRSDGSTGNATRLVSQSLTNGEVPIDPMWSTISRRTYADAYVDTNIQSVSIPNAVRGLLNSATVLLPLRAVDRYIDGTDVKTRNYGTLGGAAIIGDTTTAMDQCPFTDGQKGVRTTAAAGGIRCLRLPFAWIPLATVWTVYIRFQRPPDGGAQGYAAHVYLGDSGHNAGWATYQIRQAAGDETKTDFQGVAEDVTMARYNPTVLALSAATGATGAVTAYLDGAVVSTRNKSAGPYTGLDHVIGGLVSGGAYVHYAHLQILDVIIVPAQHTAAEVALMTAALQYPDAPKTSIFTGQSNCVGGGLLSQVIASLLLPALPNHLVGFCDESSGSMWNRGWGPCDARPTFPASADRLFGPELTILAAKTNELLAKFGSGGMGAQAWIGLDAAVKIGLADQLMRELWLMSCRPNFANLVFLQGETDGESVGLAAATYQGYLTAIATRFRYALGAAGMRMVIGRLNIDCQNVAPCVSWQAVRDGEELFGGVAGNPGAGGGSDANAVCIDLDSENLIPNDYHYPSVGHLGIGTLLAQGMQ